MISIVMQNPLDRKTSGEFMEDAILVPHAEASETEVAWIARLDLPGVPPGDITVRVCAEGHVHVEGEIRPRREANETLVWSERGYARFHRSFDNPPGGILTDKITARSFHGELILTLPKANKGSSDQEEVKIPVTSIA